MSYPHRLLHHPLPRLLHPPYFISSILSLTHQLNPLPNSSAPVSYLVCAGLTSASEEVPVGLKRERGSVCSTRHCLSLRITIYTCFITSTVLRKHRSPTLPPKENLPRPPENPPREPSSPRQGISAASYTNSGMTIPAKISSTLLTA